MAAALLRITCSRKHIHTYTSILSLSLFVCLCPPLATPFYRCLSPIQTQSHMYIMLTHPVSLYPWSASAAQWALILKTEQIKVTVGRAEPATDNTICQVYLCVCVCIYFYCLLPTSKQWHGSRESRCQMAPVPLKEKLTLIAPIIPNKTCYPLWIQARKQRDECSFESSLISPDEDYGIWFPLVPAGSFVTHLGLLLAHQCCSDTCGFLFHTLLWWEYSSHGHLKQTDSSCIRQTDGRTDWPTRRRTRTHKLESYCFYIFICPSIFLRSIFLLSTFQHLTSGS